MTKVRQLICVLMRILKDGRVSELINATPFWRTTPKLIFWIVVRGRTRDNIPASLRLLRELFEYGAIMVRRTKAYLLDVLGHRVLIIPIIAAKTNRKKNRRPNLSTVLFVTRDAIFFANFNPLLQLVGTSFPRQMDLKVIVFSGSLSLELAPKNSGIALSTNQ